MTKNYALRLLLLCFIITATFYSCTNHDDSEYVEVSPVVLEVSQVPYPLLSDYNFFDGELKNQQPAHKVLPYKPASDLFSDYAHKKRFVWMPPGSKATYNGDDNALEFPIGAVLIKTFYYDNVQPGNTTKIIETRLLIKQSETTPTNSGWYPYDYIWNEEQTEAYLDTEGNGSLVPISFTENGVNRNINYKVPGALQCRTCHKLNPQHILEGEVVVPIGPKPQNLNNIYDYGTSQRNQLQKWIAEGYLENNLPEEIHSTVDWKDTSQSLEMRARSYIDINCAHCHRDGGHCDYTNMRFNFSNTDLSTFGVCMQPLFLNIPAPYVINAGDGENSELPMRMNSNVPAIMMPIIGRSIVHEEAVSLIKEWINSLPENCE